jgi:hypothetical protein
MDIVLHVEINDKFPRIREACEFSEDALILTNLFNK